MSNLSRSRGLISTRGRRFSFSLEHEIETVKPGKIEAASHFLGGEPHFSRVLDRGHHRGMLLSDLPCSTSHESKAGGDGAAPARL